MSKPIPPEMREQLADDPFMQQCILENKDCNGRIEWNHGLSYAGKRVNELYAIVPMCHFHHEKEAQYRETIQRMVRYRIQFFSARDDFRAKYPKSTLL